MDHPARSLTRGFDMTNTHGWPEGLFKRPRSPYWWYKVYALDPETGRKVAIRKSTKTTSETKAKKIRVSAIAELSGGFNPRVERIPFAELKAALVSDYQAKGNKSLDRADYAFKHLSAAFGRNRVVGITAGRLAAYLSNRLEEGAALADGLSRVEDVTARISALGTARRPNEDARLPRNERSQERTTGVFQ